MAAILTPELSPAGEARYLIAQYMEDIFRREVRNVGVIVQKSGDIVARFIGESGNRIDGRKLSGFRNPDVFRQWVTYWRKTIASDADPFSTLCSTGRGNFLVIDGGRVTDTGYDTAADIATYLYSVLVSEAGWETPLVPATSDDEDEVAAVGMPASRLPTELTNTFRDLNILATSADQPPLVSHPIRVREPVPGTTTVPHEPQFTQKNGRLWVMEPLDFSGRARDAARDHAGLTAFMFEDLKDAYGTGVETIAIYRGPEDPTDADIAAVKYALAMIGKTKSPVVDWRDKEARIAFVEERRLIALQPA